MSEKIDFKLVKARYERQQERWRTRNSDFIELRNLFDDQEDYWWEASDKKVERLALVFNYLAPIVEKHASFLAADPPSFSVLPSSPNKGERLAASRAEKILNKLHRANHFQKTLLQAAIESALLGTAWLKLYVDRDGTSAKAVRYCYAKPEYVYPEIFQSVYTEEMKYLIYAYQISLDDARDEYGQDVKSDAELEYDEERKRQKSEELTTIIEYWDKECYALNVGGKDIENGKNPYFGIIPFIPLPFLTDPGQIHGKSIVKQIVKANRYLNLITSRKGDSVKMHCNPPLALSGATPSSRDNFLRDLEGGVFFLSDNQKLDMVTWQGEPPTVEEQQDRTLQFIHDAAYMPPQAFGYSGAQISGIAMKLAFDPLVKIQRQVRGNFEVGLQKLNRYVLMLTEKFLGKELITEEVISTERSKQRVEKLAGEQVKGHYDTEVIWPGVLPKDDLSASQFELEKKRAKVQSTWTTMENLGFANPEDELEIIREEAGDPALNPTDNATMLTAAARGISALSGANEPIGERGIVPGEPGPVAGPGPSAEKQDRAWSQSEGAGDESAMFGPNSEPVGPSEGTE
ncbi:MAG: phage portal protein [Minisyncoccota bacterium]